MNDRNWTMKFISDGCKRLTGYPSKAFTKDRTVTLAQLIHPDDAESVYEEVQKAVQIKKPYKLTYRVRAKSGKEKWVWEQGQGHFNAKGELEDLEGIIIDITERKEIENALRDSKELFRTVFQYADIGIALVDGDGHPFECNEKLEKMLGYSKNELSRTTLEKITHPEDVKKDQSLYKKLIAGRIDSYKIEKRLIKKSGKELWGRLTVSPVHDKNGKNVFYISMVEDITRQKEFEARLRNEKNTLRLIIDHIPDFIYMKDRKGRFVGANKTVADYMGANSPEELIGKSDFDYYPRQTAKIFLEEEQKVIRSATPLINKNEPGTDPSGKVRWIQTTKIPVGDAQGKITGIVGIGHENTKQREYESKLRESETKYRTLFERMLNGLALHEVVVNEEGTPVDYIFLEVNDAFEKITRLKREKIIGKRITEIIPDIRKSDPDLISIYGEVALTGKETSLEIYFDPFEKWFSISVYSPKRGIFVTIFEDITARKKAEEEKEEIQKQLFQAQKMEAIGRLTGGVAHDFNNMLSVIIGYSDLILGEMGKENTHYKHIEEIRKAGKRSTSITQQLLAFSRKQILQPIVLNLNTIVQDIEKMLRRLIGEDTDLVTRLAEDIGNIKLDPAQIEQVIMNIAVNARDAMPEGGKLTIETCNVYLDEEYASKHVSAKPGSYVLLAISDNGIGMSKEVLDHIFEPFYTTKSASQGTGLGLSTVYGIVKQSGGNIWVYSEPGRGTTFKIYFPRVMEKAEVDAGKTPNNRAIRGSESVLVIEDDDLVREMIRLGLQSLGYAVVEAGTSRQAFNIVHKLNDYGIDLIVTDVVLPQMSGRDAVRIIQEELPDVKVLYMSGYTDRSIVHHGILDEGLYFIPKPFTLHDLGKKVREILDK
jgi:PAS domain S-box-containing protein